VCVCVCVCLQIILKLCHLKVAFCVVMLAKDLLNKKSKTADKRWAKIP